MDFISLSAAIKEIGMIRIAWGFTLVFALALSFLHPLVPMTTSHGDAARAGISWGFAIYVVVMCRSLIGLIFPGKTTHLSWIIYAVAAFILPPILYRLALYFAA